MLPIKANNCLSYSIGITGCPTFQVYYFLNLSPAKNLANFQNNQITKAVMHYHLK